MRVLLSVLAVAAVLFASSPAIASGTVIFEDNFDSDTVGATPDNPAVGTWVAAGSAPDIQVMDSTPPDPIDPVTPVSSPNAFSIVRSGWNQMNAAFERQTNPADLIRFEVDFYGATGARPYVDLLDGSTELNWVMTGGDGSIMVPTGVGQETSISTVTYNVDAWNHLIMDYSPAASTFDFSVNGNSHTGIPLYQSSTGLDAIGFSNVTNAPNGRGALYDNASIVRNPGTGNETVMFDDNFDSGTVGSLPGPASVGTWVLGGGAEADMQVVDANPPEDPGLIEAVSIPNYLSIVRTGWNQMTATFERLTNPADRIRFEVDFYGAAGAYPYVDIWDGSTELNWVMGKGDGSIGIPGDPPTATITYDLDAWNHLIMDYSPTAGTFDLSINGNVQMGIPLAAVTAGIDGIGLSCVVNGADYGALYDNVLITLNPDSLPLLPGDANGDGVVNAADATMLAANWQTASGATWAMGDFNDDGAVDDADATILAANWQTGASASVPEPSTGLMILVGILSCLGIVRRKPHANLQRS